MRVALTMRITSATGYDEPRDSISHDWIRWLRAADHLPLLLPNGADDAASYMDGLAPDLLVLTGGDDVGATPERDATERALVDHALRRGLPVLGVCRGLQLANLHFGGTLSPVDGHAAVSHRVSPTAEWRTIYSGEIAVNSFHRWGVAADGLASPLMATAHDDAGNIEALVHRTLPLAAVMWHPERAGAPAADTILFTRLAGEGAFWR